MAVLSGSGAQVSVRILGGLMALGYQIGTIMKRTSAVFSDDRITVKARHCPAQLVLFSPCCCNV